MKRRWRRIARILHRDLGYLFFGITVVYAVSGLALNHRKHWNPSYEVSNEVVAAPADLPDGDLSREQAVALLEALGIEGDYRKHYGPTPSSVRVFFDGGTATWDRATAKVEVEQLMRRPILHSFNKLHYNPGLWWTWFADAYAVALLLIAFTGIFILPGRQGITRRGGVLVLLGVIVPGLAAFFYL